MPVSRHNQKGPEMRFDTNGEQIKQPEWIGVEGAETADPYHGNRMIQIEKLIADLQDIHKKFGNTCVYIRQFGVSWGAVAMNREAEDERNGVFALEDRYRQILEERIAQIERLRGERDSERDARQKADDALRQKDRAMSVMFKRLDKAGVDYSDLIP